MKRWVIALGVVAGVATVLALLFVPYDLGVDHVARLLGNNPTTVDGLGATASVLLAGCVAELLLLAWCCYLLYGESRPAKDTSPPSTLGRSFEIGEVVRRVLGELGGTRRTLTIAGYSLSFAEPLRLELHTRALPDLAVVIAVPTESYIVEHCLEDKEIGHRISSQQGRIAEWQRLATIGHVRSVTVTRHHGPPNLFSIMSNREVIYYGRYPLENVAGGKHILHPNLPYHRLMQRVDEQDSNLLFHLLLQSIDSQVHSA
ncbi:MAG: hypothetical protein ACR2N4_18480 [Jatrophihabitans sp.]